MVVSPAETIKDKIRFELQWRCCRQRQSKTRSGYDCNGGVDGRDNQRQDPVMAAMAVSLAETLTTTLVLKVPFSGGQNSMGTPRKLLGLRKENYS